MWSRFIRLIKAIASQQMKCARKMLKDTISDRNAIWIHWLCRCVNNPIEANTLHVENCDRRKVVLKDIHVSRSMIQDKNQRRRQTQCNVFTTRKDVRRLSFACGEHSFARSRIFFATNFGWFASIFYSTQRAFGDIVRAFQSTHWWKSRVNLIVGWSISFDSFANSI